jgi:hypothetical protein
MHWQQHKQELATMLLNQQQQQQQQPEVWVEVHCSLPHLDISSSSTCQQGREVLCRLLASLPPCCMQLVLQQEWSMVEQTQQQQQQQQVVVVVHCLREVSVLDY